MKYKKEFLFISLILLIYGFFFYLETQLPFFKKFLPIEENKLIVIILNINLLLILLLLFLVTRTLVKTYVEKKRGIWGAGLKTKLTLTMLIVSFIPSFTLSVLATGFFHISMDKWFSQKIEDTLDSAVELSQYYYNSMFQRHEKTGQALSEAIARQKLLENREGLNKIIKKYIQSRRIDRYAIYDPYGNIITSNLGQEIDERLSGKTGSYRKEGAVREIITLKDGELLMAGTKIVDEYGDERAILFIGGKIKIHGTKRVREITSIRKDFKESRAFKKLLKYSFYIPLSLITILTIFFSVWVGIKMATGITTPIEKMKEGAAIIAKGKFDINLEERGKDEIGTLVSAFNSMAKELKITKDEIEAKRKYMEVILDNVATGIISTDKAGSIQLINSAAQSILGIREQIPTGTSLRQIFPDEIRRQMKSFLRDSRDESGRSITKDMRVTLQNDIKYIRASLTTLKDETSKTEGFIITFDDITYIVRAEKLATWREIAKKLTHEIKNPLTPIVLSAQRIRRKLMPDSERCNREILDETTSIIIKSVDDIKGIVNELTKLTHISQTKGIENINSIVEETVSPYRNLYNNIVFQLDQKAVPEFRIDRDGIKRAIINLISNSAKAIGNRQGIIVITTTYDENKGSAILEFADNGPGIPGGDKEKIFDPYFTTDKHGTGLGLAIVHSIILEHHGRIHVEDNIPEGIKFIIELPVIDT